MIHSLRSIAYCRLLHYWLSSDLLLSLEEAYARGTILVPPLCLASSLKYCRTFSYLHSTAQEQFS